MACREREEIGGDEIGMGERKIEVDKGFISNLHSRSFKLTTT